MIKYFCDKCGYEISDYNMPEMMFTVTVAPKIRIWADDDTGTYILCYDCVRELNKFLGQEEKKL